MWIPLLLWFLCYWSCTGCIVSKIHSTIHSLNPGHISSIQSSLHLKNACLASPPPLCFLAPRVLFDTPFTHDKFWYGNPLWLRQSVFFLHWLSHRIDARRTDKHHHFGVGGRRPLSLVMSNIYISSCWLNQPMTEKNMRKSTMGIIFPQESGWKYIFFETTI